MLTIKKYSYISPQHAYPLPPHLKAAMAGGIDMGKLYRSLAIDYPKFFKMDTLSKLGFLAAELLTAGEEKGEAEAMNDRSVVCFNKSASLEADIAYSKTIQKENFFPSPSLFVYTLPSIVTGEIAIRHKLRGETSFYVSPEWNAELLVDTVRQIFAAGASQSVIAAWIECEPDSFEAFMMLIGNYAEGLPLSAENANELISDFRIHNIF
ncbi:MAG: hypothetical protein LBD21_01690 [Tannerellaceae bacterium]|jgi:3-oxoacyl-[acyl-carrier-protein] synthase-1|nr:hypothetical protein [Tannerellaceae bacterium]